MTDSPRRMQNPGDDRGDAAPGDSYRKARAAVRLRKSLLPDAAVHQLAEEVVTQLVTRLYPARDPARMASQAEVERLCDALLSDDPNAASRMVRRAREDGAPLATVYLGHLAEAARTLGRRWEEDRVSFLAMSAAAGRIFAIMRALRPDIANPRAASGSLERLALFATVPGEEHTLGITMAADLFRSRGWRIDLRTGLTHEELIESARGTPYRIVGISAGHPAMIPALARLVVALRITHPQAHLVLSGQIVAIEPEVNLLIGADDVAADSDAAMALLQKFAGAEPQFEPPST